MKNKIIATNNAPAAIGPYSQGVEASGKILFVSGQLPIDPKTGEFAGKDIKSQTLQSLNNIKAIIEAAGYSLENVCKTTVLLSDINDFTAMNEVYAKFFGDVKPARAAFQVAAIPKAALIEIEAYVS